MKKFFALSVSLVIVVMILTVGFSSGSASRGLSDFPFGENVGSMGASSLTALRGAVEDTGTKPKSPLEGPRTEAVEVADGDSTSFQGLALTVNSISEIPDCYLNCFEVSLGVSVGGGEITNFLHNEGDIFSYEGYRIKISQVAPRTPQNGVLRRAVFLFSTE
jgi:hypothetical protein